ncbi:hypothetical protein FB567DRAFT_13844 [Paraphoma chrysanthemicola]|uniref:Pentatricopeptide repeat protein n=1 Tax=Paraphoma chrysanthemicola TaxID=798071 RepID=A0A8K0W4E5_9PLEO|nr:hypothetical protein FB567DRAFT_13844 [Paraphoma chrysanthemicola]
MPRARIRNARFIASAESPLLPFLAPRVFAESPIQHKCRRHGEERCTSQAKEEGKCGTASAMRPKSFETTPWRNTFCTRARHQNVGSAHGLLLTNTLRSRPFKTLRAQHPAASRYADISSFAREHLRERPSVSASPRRAASRAREPTRRTRPSVLNQRGPVKAALRARALALELERLATIETSTAYRSVAARSQSGLYQSRDGQYRSIRRRILNLQQWNLVQYDFAPKFPGARQRASAQEAIAALDRSVYSTVGRHTRKIVVKHDPRCARWSANLFKDSAKHELHQTWLTWMSWDISTRKRAYQRLLVYLLDRRPGRAMQFIHMIANDPLLRDGKTELIADALAYLSKLHVNGAYSRNGSWSLDKTAVRRSFVPAFFHIYRKAVAGHRYACSQDLLFNITKLADASDLRRVFDCLVEHKAFLGFETLLHYGNAFAKAGDFQCALQCLDMVKAMRQSANWDAICDQDKLRWTCALILRRSMAEGQNYHQTPVIVAAIVRLGIKMDILLYNIVMHNAMEAGDYATAFKVYNALDSNGLKADRFTHSIMLHGCASQSNPALFSQFAHHCADVAETTEDPWLATEYLYYLYIRHQNDADKSQTLALLRHTFSRFFTSKPWELLNDRLRMSTLTNQITPSLTQDPLTLTPPTVAVYLVLQAQIQMTQTGGPQQLQDLYQRFRSLVQGKSDPTLTKLGKLPIAWNAFLLAFCHLQQFASASQLIKDMTDGSPQPNIYSWNIFMQAFFKTGQVQAAERVFGILRSRGIDPDQYTYGVMLRGYAKAQHIERIGLTMEHIDAEGEMHPDLLRSLARVPNRNELMLTLEKARVRKEAKEALKTQEEAEAERKEWEQPRLLLDEQEAVDKSAIPLSPIESSRTEGFPGVQARSDIEDLPNIRRATPQQQENLDKPPQRKPSMLETRPENKADPDVQYRRLQERLGIASPDLADSSNEEQLHVSQAVGSFGADLPFKSTIPSAGTSNRSVVRKILQESRKKLDDQ